MDHEDDDRTLIAKAWGWGYQAVSISLEMVVPALLGLWIDRLLGMLPVFLILGAVFGMVAGMMHLVGFAKRVGEQGKKPSNHDRT